MIDPKSTLSDTNEWETGRFVTDFVPNSNVLCKVFSEKCNRVINSKKKSAKDLFLKMWRYERVYGQRGTQSNDEVQRKRFA